MKDKIRTVYFAKSGNHVKIGVTNDITKRLSQLQNGTVNKIEVLLTLHGSANDEKAYHNEFKHLRIRGEWFNYTDELKKYIDSMNKLPKIGEHASFWAGGYVTQETQYEMTLAEKAYYWIDGVCVGRTPRGAIMLSNTNHFTPYIVPIEMFDKEKKDHYLLSFYQGSAMHDAYKTVGSFDISQVSSSLTIRDFAASKCGFSDLDKKAISEMEWLVPWFDRPELSHVHRRVPVISSKY